MPDKIVTGRQVKKVSAPKQIEWQPVLHAKQKEMWNDQHRFQVVSSGRRFGKAIHIETEILLTDYTYTIVGDLKEGDEIFGDDGKPTKIIKCHDIYYNRPCYKITFDNGDEIVTDAWHDWIVKIDDIIIKLTTREIFDAMYADRKFVYLPDYVFPDRFNWIIPKAKFIIHVEKVDSVPVRCISVNNKSHLFLAGKSLIPTHNSIYAAYRIIYEALNKPNSINWVIAPTYSMTETIWRKILTFLPDEAVVDINRQISVIYFINGASIWAKSADRPDNLRGEGLDFIVMDEASYIKEDVWEFIIRPALADKKGKAVIISTPKGKNFFYRLFMRGKLNEDGTKDPRYEDWISFNCSSWDNPIIDRAELLELRDSLSSIAYRQEMLAEFVDDADSVFVNIMACVRQGGFKPPMHNVIYVMGVDLAKHDDYTVITVIDSMSRDVVYWERFNQIDWVSQKSRISIIAKRYNNATVVIDSTGLGDPIVDDLTFSGLIVSPFRFTNATKNHIINKLKFATENREYTMPFIEVLVDEMQLYSYTISKMGAVLYSAPDGYKDDCVISLALAISHVDTTLPSLEEWDFF